MGKENSGGVAPGYGTAEGLTIRQYAAIKLCVPDSGTDWLDEMIVKSQREKFAGQYMSSIAGLHEWHQDFSRRRESEAKGLARNSYEVADKMIEQGNKKE